MSQQTNEMVLTKTVTVGITVEEAFRLYTEGIAGWWPFETHSDGEENVETVVFEGHEGGRIYERTKSGDEHLWGTVLVWDPPLRVVHSWHPGRGDENAQEVEIVFAVGDAGTRVDLTHTGWEKMGERASEMFANYDTGWDYVLGKYEVRANA
jgi:Activator of Hsp90 ATPase homolog 1-like protein